MKVYFAPLESITLSDFRNTFDSFFVGPDAYFIPFLNPMNCLKLTQKDEREIQKENNHLSKPLIPQILSKGSKETLWLIHRLKELGYSEVNLNLGCPSGTVASKGKGSGMLKDLDFLYQYLKEVFAQSELPLSIKTRIGVEDGNHWDEILSIYNQFPIQELIIHPRCTKEGYVGRPHFEIIKGLNLKTNIPIIYNGEIKGKEDIETISKAFPYLAGVMIGRGFLEYPDCLDDHFKTEEERKETLYDYINTLMNKCLDKMGWGNASFPIKEHWSYFHRRFQMEDSLYKKLMKQKDKDAFFEIVKEIFAHCPLKEKPNPGIHLN